MFEPRSAGSEPEPSQRSEAKHETVHVLLTAVAASPETHWNPSVYSGPRLPSPTINTHLLHLVDMTQHYRQNTGRSAGERSCRSHWQTLHPECKSSGKIDIDAWCCETLTNAKGEQMPALAVVLSLRCPALSGRTRRAAPGNLAGGRRSRAALPSEPQAAGKRGHPETPADIMDRIKKPAGVVASRSQPPPKPFNLQ